MKANIDKIRHIPTFIVQGRYDVVCPMRTAWDLHRAFPEAEFNLMDTCGHSAGEPATTKVLVGFADRWRDQLQSRLATE
jgi:proline iminopeptidase